jgi:hypothetical protein
MSHGWGRKVESENKFVELVIVFTRFRNALLMTARSLRDLLPRRRFLYFAALVLHWNDTWQRLRGRVQRLLNRLKS